MRFCHCDAGSITGAVFTKSDKCIFYYSILFVCLLLLLCFSLSLSVRARARVCFEHSVSSQCKINSSIFAND